MKELFLLLIKVRTVRQVGPVSSFSERNENLVDAKITARDHVDKIEQGEISKTIIK